MCRVGATHFKEEGLAGWVNEQFGLVQLAPKRQAYKTVNNEILLKSNLWSLYRYLPKHYKPISN